MTIGQEPLTREAIAHIEVGHTDVKPPTVRFLVAAFLAFVAAVPLLEIVRLRSEGANPWDQLSGIPALVSAKFADTRGQSLWDRVVASNRVMLAELFDFEQMLEDGSQIGQLIRPGTQLLFARWLGTGNEMAYIGRDGWLFYRPDVDYVTRSGFLDEATRKRRVLAADEWDNPPQTDPRAAIASFKQQLEARGITLIVMPTPVKPSIHPERLVSRPADGPMPLENPSYATFIDDLRKAGVLVFDSSQVIVDNLRATGAAQFLTVDTHWRPEAMELVAERLAEFIRMNASLPPVDASYQTQPTDVQKLGDVADMLELPAWQTLYPPETVAIRRVLDVNGQPWRPSRDADVLVLGDSFSNIYSLGSMGWGDAAGLVEHLSFALQRPVDRIVQNDEAAHATRGALHREGEARLAGKRVVVYQFANRELAFGDWKIFQ